MQFWGSSRPVPRRHRPLLLELLETRDLPSATLFPNDPSFPTQWNLHNTAQSGGVADADIDAPEAWAVTRGSTAVTVAIIDTGIDYRHRDLYRNIWINQGEIPTDIRSRLSDFDNDGLITFWDLNDPRNQGIGKTRDLNGNGRIDGGDILAAYKADGTGGWSNGISEDGDSYVDDLIGWNFLDNNNNPYDTNSHGTHVAGIIGATGDDGHGISGVVWKTQMMALRFTGTKGGGSTATAIAALDYAVAKGASISNNSWAGGPYNPTLYNAIDAARQQGHIFVTAAGNGGEDGRGDNIDLAALYPASYNLANILVVAATTKNDRISAFTNYGAQTVDLGAPGYLIYSTTPHDRYATYSGTSMAVPHVTGALALLKSAHPTWTYTQLVSQVMSTVDPLRDLQTKTVSGGRLSIGKAMTQAPSDTRGPSLVSAVPNASGANPVSSVRVTFDEPINPGSFTVADVVRFGGPNGSLAVSQVNVVAGSDNKQFDLIFAAQSTPGTYTLEVGPQILDEVGNPMARSATIVFAINPVYSFSGGGLPLSIRDLGTTTATLTINQDISIADLNVTFNINHTFNQDLYIRLVGPDGSQSVLVNRRGGSGDNFTDTILDDEATKPISAGASPYRGTFRPETTLSVFDGKNARGTWKLIIEDRQSRDVGRLNSWSLTIEGASAPVQIQAIEEVAEDTAPTVEPAFTLNTSSAPTLGTNPGVAVSLALPRTEASLPVLRVQAAPRADGVRAQLPTASTPAPTAIPLNLTQNSGGSHRGSDQDAEDDLAARMAYFAELDSLDLIP